MPLHRDGSIRTAVFSAVDRARAASGRAPIAWLAALLLVVFWVLISWKLGEEYQQAIDSGSANLVNLGHAFAEQTARTVDVADQTIRDLRHELMSPNPPRDLAAYLHSMGVRPMFHLISVIGPDGILVNSSRPFTALDLSDREHFRVHADASPPVDRVFVSRPVLGRVSGKWSLQVTRPMLGRGGEFLGVIVLSLSPEYFSDFYNQIDLGADGAIGLIGQDGVIRAWGGARTGVGPIGAALQTGAALHPSGLPSGRVVTAAGPDQVDRIWGFKAIPEFGLGVLVGATTRHLSVGYEQRRWAMLAAGMLVTVLAGALAMVAIRQARAQARLIDDLVDQRAATARAARARSLFLENVSHELRTPLHGVVGACELLQLGTISQEDRVLVQVARRSADQLHNLLELLIGASVLGSREGTEQRKTVELRSFVDDLLEEVLAQMPAGSPPVRLHVAPTLPRTATFDADAVRQLLRVILTESLAGGGAAEVSLNLEPQAAAGMLFTVAAVRIGHEDSDPIAGADATVTADSPTLHDELIGHLAASAGVEVRIIERSDARVRASLLVDCREAS